MFNNVVKEEEWNHLKCKSDEQMRDGLNTTCKLVYVPDIKYMGWRMDTTLDLRQNP
jgi:hypothetical protein